VLELSEDECGLDDLGGLPWAGGDALEGGPALAEQGESSFSLAAEAAEQAVSGFGVRVQALVSWRVLDGDVDADPGSLVAAVGQRGHSGRCGAVEERQGVGAGGGDVVDVARLGRGCPDREAAGEHDGLHVRAGAMLLAGVPGYESGVLHRTDNLHDLGLLSRASGSRWRFQHAFGNPCAVGAGGGTIHGRSDLVSDQSVRWACASSLR